LSFEDFVTPTRAPEKTTVSHVSSQKKNPQDNGDRLALIVFLNPIFWVLPVPRLAQKYDGRG